MKPKRKTSAGVLRTLWRICANECELEKLKSGTDKAIRSAIQNCQCFWRSKIKLRADLALQVANQARTIGEEAEKLLQKASKTQNKR